MAIASALSKLSIFATFISLAAQPALANEPSFSSTADTVFDVIETGDPSSFSCLTYEGRDTREMWDKRLDAEPTLSAFLFQAHFMDSPSIDIILNPEFQSEAEARAEAMRYTRGLGQLPLVLRSGIKQFGIHKGREGFHGGSGKIFMYQDQSSHRISQNKLEESIFHEAVHASLDARYRLDPDWVAAQNADGRFLTRYAASRPDREDLAETALFAYALLRHPGRIPPVDSRDILAAVPNRIEFIRAILDNNEAPDEGPTIPVSCQ
ncbi:hypothetical protein [Tateyamaria sp.]|uniref:hypothetical protein n=1 Tax=Tateyamaria sp. TaxID=1929288 RepID=UPI00329C6CAE